MDASLQLETSEAFSYFRSPCGLNTYKYSKCFAQDIERH